MSRAAPIVPEPDGLQAVYWDAVQREQLLLQHCKRCGHYWHPPSEFCPFCQAHEFEWIAASGDGVVHSYAVVPHAVHPAVVDWLPYTILLVDLVEGPRLIGRLLDAPHEPAVGEPVRLRFERYTNLKVPAFALRDADA
jgi:hypothetical protein